MCNALPLATGNDEVQIPSLPSERIIGRPPPSFNALISQVAGTGTKKLISTLDQAGQVVTRSSSSQADT